MTVGEFISSLVGGLVVVVATQFFSFLREFRMKGELYREILYREQLDAYRKIHALCARYVTLFNNPPADVDKACLASMVKTFASIEMEIERVSLFMPDRVMTAIKESKIISESLSGDAVFMAEALGLEPGAAIPENARHIITWNVRCCEIMEIIRESLGVEVLAKGLERHVGSQDRRIKALAQRVGNVLSNKISGKRTDADGD